MDATDRFRHNENHNDQLSVNLNTSKFNDPNTEPNSDKGKVITSQEIIHNMKNK